MKLTELMNELEELKKENAFLKQWKDDVVNSLARYDANSIEEVYAYGIEKGKKDMQDMMGRMSGNIRRY